MIQKTLKFLIVFMISGITAFSQEGVVIDQIIGVVGNKMILQSEVESQYLSLQSRGMYTGDNMKCEIFEELLYQKLLLHQAVIDSVEVTQKEVEQNLNARISHFLEQFGGDISKLEEYFGKTMPEIKNEFKEVIRDQLVTQKMQGEIAKDASITPSEVKDFFGKIPQDSLPFIPEEIELAQIVRFPPVSNEQRKAAIDYLNELRARVLKGEKFSTLAVLYSEDPGSAKNGGSLGLAGRGDFVPEFSAAAFNLEPGEVSKVVETEFGFHIILMEAKKGDKAELRHIIRKPRITPQATQKARTLLDSISVVIRTDTLTFEQAAMKYSDDKDTRNSGGIMLNPYNGTSKFESKHIDPTTYYMVKNMKIGQISEPFETQDNRGRTVMKVIMLKSKTKPHKANLDDDYQRIKTMALENKKSKIVDEWVKKKQKASYVRINKKYQTCNFRFDGWLK